MCGFALPCLKIPIIIIINYCTKHKRQCWKVLRRRRPRASRTEHRNTSTAQVLVPQVRQWSRPEKWGPRWIIQCPRCAWVSETRGLPPTGVPRWAEGKAPASFIPKLYPEVSPASRSIFGTSGPEESGSVGSRGKIGETTLRPRGRGVRGQQGGERAGPRRGGRAPAVCGSASPRTRPCPAALGPDSPLCPPAALGPGSRWGRTRQSFSPSAGALRPGLPAALPARARPQRGPGLRRASPEPSSQAAARAQPRNARRRLG